MSRRRRTRAPLRVCFFIPALADGGAQRQCIMIINELAQRSDVRVMLVRCWPGVHDHLLDTSRIDVRWLRVRSNTDPRIILKMARLMRRERTDVLFSWLQAADLASYFIRRLTPSLRWVLAERNSWYRDELRFRVRARLGRSADVIVSNSLAGDDYWSSRAAGGPRFVIPNIVQEPPAEVDASTPTYDVVVVGRLELQKNPILTMRVLQDVLSKRPRVSAAFVGDGALRGDIEAMRANDPRSQESIHILGFRQDAAAIISRARVLLTLSSYEGMPNVLVESVMRGTTVVASRIRQHVDILGTEYPLLVADLERPDEAVDAVLRALDDAPPDVTELRKKLEGHSAERVAAQYAEVFESVARR